MRQHPFYRNEVHIVYKNTFTKLLNIAIFIILMTLLCTTQAFGVGNPAFDAKCDKCGTSYTVGLDKTTDIKSIYGVEYIPNIGNTLYNNYDAPSIYYTYNSGESYNNLCSNCVESIAQAYLASLQFNVTLPTSLPIHVSNNGIIATSDQCTIVNNGTIPIEVTNINVTGQNGWNIVPMNTNFTQEQIGTKKFGLSIMDNEVTTDGLCDTSGFGNILGGNNKIIQYDAVVNSQTTAINETIANVIFTVDAAVEMYTITTPSSYATVYANDVALPANSEQQFEKDTVIKVEATAAVGNCPIFALQCMFNETTIFSDGVGNPSSLTHTFEFPLQSNTIIDTKTRLHNGQILITTVTVTTEQPQTIKYLASITAREQMERVEPYFPGYAYDNKLNVTATYSDGSQESISSSDYTILDGSSLKSGQSSITVKYLDKKCSIPIQTFSSLVYYAQCFKQGWSNDPISLTSQFILYYMDGMTWRQWLNSGYGNASHAGKYFIAQGQWVASVGTDGKFKDIVYDGTGIKIGVFGRGDGWWDAYICNSSKQVIDIDSPINSTSGYYLFVDTNIASKASLSLSSTENSLTGYSIKHKSEEKQP